ncbi:MAG: Hpt domain-containing protein, partial [Candidatus Eremiobacterota bacterium]
MAPGYDEFEMMTDFLAEAWEHCEVLDREFVGLEQDPGRSERIDVIFRIMHTLKGGAGFLNLEMLECMSHYAETLLTRMRSGELEVTSERVELLLATADAVKAVLASIERTGGEGDPVYADLLVRLRRAGEAPSDATRERQELEELQAQLLANLEAPERRSA